MVTSVTPSVPPPPACKNNSCTQQQQSPLPYKSPDSNSGDLPTADPSQQIHHNNPLLSVALRPTAILFHLLRSSSKYQSSPTFPSTPPKKGFVEKMFGRRKSVTLNESDPTYKTVYLGNVVTSLPKGDGCLKKPLEAIWKHYKATKQPPAEMILTVTNAGLKARTAEQGVIQYKANRLTHCAAPLEYPRLFAWIYKHDAKNLKYESRCHAVLCHDEFKARELAAALESRLQFVFSEWLRTKKSRSQILDRLRNPELAAALPAMPARKQMLSAGQKYKPPEAKARSLSSIREVSDEDPSSDDDLMDTRNLPMLVADRLCLNPNDRGYSYSAESSTPPAGFEDIEEEEEVEEEPSLDLHRAAHLLQQQQQLQQEQQQREVDDEDVVYESPTHINNGNDMALTSFTPNGIRHRSSAYEHHRATTSFKTFPNNNNNSNNSGDDDSTTYVNSTFVR